ncbi:MAG TPA: tetratricopeptide repeat protein [Terriglobales bacterium]
MVNRLRFQGFIGVLLLAILCFAADVARGSPQASAPHTVAGIVRDASGAPVSGARVLLVQGANVLQQETTTHQDGKFSFTYDKPGAYLLKIHKDGYVDSKQSLTLPSPTTMELAISLSSASSGQQKSSASSEPMQFSDKPDFKIAGITDWTAAGGHGSDANLRASEALARDTRNLGSKGKSSATYLEQEQRLRAAVQKDPASFDANHALGEFCLQEHHYADATVPLERARELDPKDSENSYALAQAYEGAGQHDKARALAQSLVAARDSAELHHLLGDIEEQLDHPLVAEQEYERAVQLEPSEDNYFAWGGELLMHRAVQPAIEVFSKGVQAFPRSERMLAGLGAALYASGAYKEAAQRVCEASDLSPSAAEPYLFLGRMEQFAPDPLPCVVPELARFLRDQPENAFANYYYAVALWKTQGSNGAEEVEKLLQKAIQVDPRFAEAYLQLGIVQTESGDSEHAMASFQRSIAANPGLPDPHFRLAQAYKRAGDDPSAAREFQTFQRLKQSDAQAVEQQRRAIRQFVVVLKNSGDSNPR